MGEKIYTATDAAIVLSAVCDIETEVGDAWHALRLAEERETKTSARAEQAVEQAKKAKRSADGAREDAKQRRLELGHALVKARKLWPTKGPAPRGLGRWESFLERLGISQQRAWDLMQAVGYINEVSPDSDHSGDTSSTKSIDSLDNENENEDEECESEGESAPVPQSSPSAPAPQEPERASGRGKPEWLMRALVRHYTSVGDLVCDPFAGYGSTLRAARAEQRRAIGSEISEDVARLANDRDLRVGRWQDSLADSGAVDAIICDPPYSARTHAAVTTRTDGSNPEGLTPTYAAWTADDVREFVLGWSTRCRGWIVALTDSELIPAYTASYRAAGRYAFAPVPIVIKGMSVRISGDGPSSWCVYAMVARPATETFSRWGTLPGAYVGTKQNDLFEVANGD